MDSRHVALAAVLVAVLLAIPTLRGARKPFPQYPAPADRAAAARAASLLIARWPERPRALAAALLRKYGAPDSLEASRLSWNRRGPWTTVAVFREPEPGGSSAHLLETVAYGRVSWNRWRELWGFGHGAAYDPVGRELSARASGPADAYLALNLSDEILRGRRSAADARAFYDKTLNLALSGKSSPYMTGLLFRPRGAAVPSASRNPWRGPGK